MKKIAYILAAALVVSSCDKEDDDVDITFNGRTKTSEEEQVEEVQDDRDQDEQEESGQDANANSNANYAYTSAQNLSVPHLNTRNIYKEYYVENADTAVFNYALEWNEGKLHSQWVAFEFNALTRQQVVSRSSIDFTWDYTIETEAIVESYNHTSDGYDRGHLCASADRLYSEEANAQTFYYSNVSPMISKKFNQGYWEKLESLFRSWCLSDKYDHVYVAKGGTTDSLLIDYVGTTAASDNKIPTTDSEGKSVKGLYVPKYYFMAILTEKGGEYAAMAFLVEHKEYLMSSYGTADFKSQAVSIDQLEKFTGIDFFCNLPDQTEESVESVYDVGDWEW